MTVTGGLRPFRAHPPAWVPDDPTSVLALAARRGEAGATAAFVRATHDEVWRFVAALTGPGDADDLTQETYLRALDALPGYAGRSTARTWLLAIARRTCADHLRAAIRRRRLGIRLHHYAADTATPDHAGRHATAELLHALPTERRVAFALTQVLGLSYAEAADVEGVPVGTIRSRVARARADLVDAVHAAEAG
jgi:RNA polymerase sigma-70 factor (ECF subfamily)